MRTEEETRALVRERYGAIAQAAAELLRAGIVRLRRRDGAGRPERDRRRLCRGRGPSRRGRPQPRLRRADPACGAAAGRDRARPRLRCRQRRLHRPPRGRARGPRARRRHDRRDDRQGARQRRQARLRQCRVPRGRDRADAGRGRQHRRGDLQLRPEPACPTRAARSPRCSAFCGRAAGFASPTSSRPASCPPRCARWQRSMSAASPAPWPRSATWPCSRPPGSTTCAIAEAKPIALSDEALARQYGRGRHRRVPRLRRHAQKRHRARRQAGIVAFIRREAGGLLELGPGHEGLPNSSPRCMLRRESCVWAMAYADEHRAR